MYKKFSRLIIVHIVRFLILLIIQIAILEELSYLVLLRTIVKAEVKGGVLEIGTAIADELRIQNFKKKRMGVYTQPQKIIN